MKTKVPQFELPAAGACFNLVAERGVDGQRAIADMAERMRKEREAAEFRDRMQGKLSECPGFVGCYPLGSPESAGRVTVQPSMVDDAVDYMRRRYVVAQVGYKRGLGFMIEFMPQRRGLTRARAAARLRPEQFEFSLEGQQKT